MIVLALGSRPPTSSPSAPSRVGFRHVSPKSPLAQVGAVGVGGANLSDEDTLLIVPARRILGVDGAAVSGKFNLTQKCGNNLNYSNGVL